MLIKEIKNIRSGERELRSFARVVGGAAVILGALAAWHGKPHAAAWLFAGLCLILCGEWAPRVLKPAQKIWMALALVMGWVMTRLILGLVFFLILTPIAWIARLVGNRFLDLEFNKGNAATYWRPKGSCPRGLQDYEKQF